MDRIAHARIAPATVETIALALRGLVPWPQELPDPSPNSRVAVRSTGCTACEAWHVALERAGRRVTEAADADLVEVGTTGVCSACADDRRTALDLAAQLGVHLVPTSARRAVRTLRALAALARTYAGAAT
jgi:hypothetical protein